MTNRRLTPDPINDELKQHALNVTDWNRREVAALLHEWAKRFNDTFRLGIETPVIGIDRLPIRTLGSYCPVRNGFGLRHEILLNVRHLDRPLALVLSTLLHELIHEWQSTYGRERRSKRTNTNNYHNREFQFMARRFGLVIDDRGHNLGVEPGPFTELLAQYGVDMSQISSPGEVPPTKIRPQGNSTLKKYSCGCTNVRCAVRLTARCLRCGTIFEEAAPSY